MLMTPEQWTALCTYIEAEADYRARELLRQTDISDWIRRDQFRDEARAAFVKEDEA